LLSQSRIDAPVGKEAAFSSDVEALLAAMSDLDRSRRLAANQFGARIDDLISKYGAEDDAQRRAAETRAIVRAAADEFWRTSAQRCQSRFC
jgi:hypothetical protein